MTDTDAPGLTTLEDATFLVRQAIEHGLAAGDLLPIGDFGLATVVPDGFDLKTIDQRQFEDEPRLPSYRSHTARFVDVESFASYAAKYSGADSVLYVKDPFGRGLALLKQDTEFATLVFDDHPAGAERTAHEGGPVTARRAHQALLVQRPTAAAKRWGAALAAEFITQEQFLDLVVDGITEIANPDGATLRDLIQDLHAIRSTAIKSVIRTGGEGAIELAENVKLHAGPGSTVTFPEKMTLRLEPFVGTAIPVTLDVRIKPQVRQESVTFALSCALLDDALALVLRHVAGSIAAETDLPAHWVP